MRVAEGGRGASGDGSCVRAVVAGAVIVTAGGGAPIAEVVPAG